jgi:hypothetical protein
MMRRPREDPRAEHGLFDRVGGLLATLSEGLAIS